jgi:hypothetical protein
MTRNEILEVCNQFYTGGNVTEREVAFARYIMKYEREACAKIVEESSLPDTYSQECLPEIANDIRARGQA